MHIFSCIPFCKLQTILKLLRGVEESELRRQNVILAMHSIADYLLFQATLSGFSPLLLVSDCCRFALFLRLLHASTSQRRIPTRQNSDCFWRNVCVFPFKINFTTFPVFRYFFHFISIGAGCMVWLLNAHFFPPLNFQYKVGINQKTLSISF